ncbi:MAG: histidinol dehydrogenase [Anaerovoracaceae bacterium]|nr:histidinol dehydrogenase [Anaerovoracaceae bacterium]
MIKILDYEQVKIEDIFIRNDKAADITAAVEKIISDVRENGDRALREYALKFDGAVLDNLEVTEEEIEDAFAAVDPALIEVIKKAAENIREYHSKQKREGFRFERKNGVILGQKITPIENAGIYIPGGTASYPSSVLMNTIPAKIAGCRQIVMVSPPSRGGTIAPVILAAAKIAGVDRIFKTGGAQAVAALAYGTESVPKVDKITGPGNAFVAEAKKQVFGKVSIDMIAGPSEILVIADEKSNPAFVAADMLSQAEHDKMATAVLVTDSRELAGKVAEELEKQLSLLPREEIARASIENNGAVIITDNLHRAVEISNELAPEHLEICTDNPFDYLDEITNAGSVFLGRFCCESLGDYLAGPNHTLPTSGTARFSSPLSVDEFIKKTQFSYFEKEALREVRDDIDIFARSEGLDAHARAATIRFEGEE